MNQDVIPTTTSERTAPRTALDLLGAARPVDASSALTRSARLELRALRAEDRAAYLDAVRASRAELNHWLPLHRRGETDDDLFDRQLAMTIAGDQRAMAFRRVAWYEGRIAGAFNIASITRGLCFDGDASWWVRSELAGRGLATDGVRALLDAAFAELPQGLGLHRVFAGIRPDHARSLRVAEKLGFRRVPITRLFYTPRGRGEKHLVLVRELDPAPATGP